MSQLKDIPPKPVMPGITGHYAHGQQTTIGLVEIEAGTVMPVHQHVHEQITYVLEGVLNMQIDDVAYQLTAGCCKIIPSNIWHGAHALTACKLIDVFSPVREAYL